MGTVTNFTNESDMEKQETASAIKSHWQFICTSISKLITSFIYLTTRRYSNLRTSYLMEWSTRGCCPYQYLFASVGILKQHEQMNMKMQIK